MIDKNLPLPDRTKVKYSECLAKIILESLFPNEFNNLNIFCERPDLKSIILDVGIEVTTSENKKQIEAENLYSKIKYGTIKNEKKALNKIETLGVKYNKGILLGIPGQDSFDEVESSFEEKLNNMNTEGFGIFRNNYLLIYSSIYGTREMIDETIEKMCTMQENKRYQFQKVYIVVPYYVYVCDLVCITSSVINVKDLQYDFSISARKMVENIEKSDV